MIRANASRYPISAQCRILGVPRSTYYWMIEHPEAERVDPIAGDVHAVRRDSRGRYGARKIKAALERKGVTASRRRIGGIMYEQGMTSAYTRRRFKPHGTRVNEARLANILDREFDNAKIDELLDVFDIRRSLSRKGNPYDNAVVESTNRLLKKEFIYRNHYTSLEQLRSDLNDYVWWFNNQRLHSTLGYRSPNEFTQQGLVL